MTASKIVAAAASGVGGAGLDVDEVFSCFLWAGNSTNSRNIVNNIDVSGEGGLVWIKDRTVGDSHSLFTTDRGANKTLLTNATDAEDTVGTAVFESFNSNGFTVGSHGRTNENNRDYVSWTFRKAPKFFDVVTFSATGSGSLTLSHNLGSAPAFIIVKSTSHAQSWYCYHHSLNGGTDPEDYFLKLDSNAAEAGPASSYWGGTAPTSTQFTVGTDLNISGRSYVAYLFAHNNNDGEFGPDSDQDIIKCGGYTGNGTAGHVINLGFEAQWVLVKKRNSSESWIIYDVMRGMPVDGNGARIRANDSEAESSITRIGSHPQGFQLSSTDGECNINGGTYIYMAIRRGPLAEPDDATKVFAVGTRSGSGSIANTNSNVLTDTSIIMRRDSSSEYNLIGARLTGENNLKPNETHAEGSGAISGWDTMNGLLVSASNGAVNTGSLVDFSWKRAPGFFDAVAYTGTGTAGLTVNHNLGVAPEMTWVKRRNYATVWRVNVAALGTDGQDSPSLRLNMSNAAEDDNGSYFGNNNSGGYAAPTSSVLTLGGHGDVNAHSSATYIAYLFATLAGVSKVGSFVGDGNNGRVIDCGFSNGARFILIKGATNTENWYVFDTARGIVAGNDARLQLDNTSAEFSNVDLVDPSSSGFIVNSGGEVNASGVTYIFYAIA